MSGTAGGDDASFSPAATVTSSTGERGLSSAATGLAGSRADGRVRPLSSFPQARSPPLGENKP